MRGLSEPRAAKGSVDVVLNVVGVTEVLGEIGSCLPKGFNLNSLLDSVKLVIKHNMELRRDVSSPWVEDQSNGLRVLVGMSKVDTSS